jgi:hypothetical protein
MAAATSGASVSGAKCLVSKKRTVAFAMSRLNASAPAGRKNGSFLPPCRQQGRRMGPEILLGGRIERDVALIVAGQVELHLGHAGPGEVEIVQQVPVRRDPRRCWVRRGCIAERSCQRSVLPIGADRALAVA